MSNVEIDFKSINKDYLKFLKNVKEKDLEKNEDKILEYFKWKLWIKFLQQLYNHKEFC